MVHITGQDRSNTPSTYHGVLALDGADHPPRRAAGADNVLVCNGEQIALFYRKFLRLLCDQLHVVHHFIETVFVYKFVEAGTERKRKQQGNTVPG